MKRCSLLFLFALAACGSDSGSTTPGTPLTVAVAVTQTADGHAVLENGTLEYACSYAFTAHATGGAFSDFAQWSNGEIDYRLTSSGAETTVSLAQADLQKWFGTDDVKSGEIVGAAQQLESTGPFSATISLRYVDGGVDSLSATSHTITLSVSC